MKASFEEPEASLEGLRSQIDQIDRQILELLNARAAKAQYIGRLKSREAVEHRHFHRPDREAVLLRRLIDLNQGPLTSEMITALFRKIISACLALEEPLKIAYLGSEGSYTHEALRKHFDIFAHECPLPGLKDVFREVEARGVDYGVVPVENSTEGMVTHTLDLFVRSPLKICGEIILPIHHCLLTRDGDFSNIRCVYGHAQALAQCRDWLEMHMKGVECFAVESNSLGAQMAAEGEACAAIASAAAGGIYGLRIAAERIENDPSNSTRFLVIGYESVPPTGQDKTSFLVSSTNTPGALFQLIEPLAQMGVNMTRIESRPSRNRLWDYYYFLDIEGHHDLPAVKVAFDRIRERANLFKFLGSYPCAIV